MKQTTLVLAWILLGSACGSGASSAPSAHAPETETATPPSDLLSFPPPSTRAVIVRDAVPYLFAAFHYTGEAGLEGLTLPPCWEPGASREEGTPCPASIPAPEGMAQEAPPTVSVVTAAGPCEAQVGAAVLLDTSGCEPSITLAHPLTGCSAPVAGLAVVGARFDPDLRYLAAPEVRVTPVSDAESVAALPDATQRTLLSEWLAEPAIADAPYHAGRTAFVSLDLGAETIETTVAELLVGPDAESCDATVERRTRVAVRRGDDAVTVDVPPPWQGVFAWRGRLVGVVTGGPRPVVVHAVQPDGATAIVSSARVWADNEECDESGWTNVEYPCGP